MLVTNIMISFTFGLIDAATVAVLHNVEVEAWASALLVQTVMGNARASECGTGDEFDSHAFFCICRCYIVFCLDGGVSRL